LLLKVFGWLVRNYFLQNDGGVQFDGYGVIANEEMSEAHLDGGGVIGNEEMSEAHLAGDGVIANEEMSEAHLDCGGVVGNEDMVEVGQLLDDDQVDGGPI
jgi:hypothetical protein